MRPLAELEQCFAVDIGWGLDWKNDIQARRVFDHMLAAAQWATQDHVVLDVSAGQMKYKPFYDHAHYLAMDAAIGDVNWDYSRLDIIGDAMHLPIRASCIDTVLNFVSLEHYPDPNRFFFEVSRVLKPGGRLYLFAPCVYLEHQQPYDFSRFTRFGLQNMCVQNGLDVVSLTPSNSILYSAITLLKWARDDVAKIRGQEQMVKRLESIVNELTPVFKYYDEGLTEQLLASFQSQTVFYQAPLNYLLVASKPGVLITASHERNGAAVLNETMACPYEKKPITWDGSSAYIAAAGSLRKYPVRNGVPHFME